MFYVKVDKSKYGRGVFAEKDFVIDEIIEICPVIPVPLDENEVILNSHLGWFIYEWHNLTGTAVVLGYGMLYNHKIRPNAYYILDYKSDEVIIKAKKNIKSGEEIFINYSQYDKKSIISMFDIKKQKEIAVKGR